MVEKGSEGFDSGMGREQEPHTIHSFACVDRTNPDATLV